MRTTFQEVPALGSASPYRTILSAANLLAAGAVIVALTVQIMNRVANDAFSAEEYFSYFTILTSLGNIVLFIAAGLYGLQSNRDTRLLSAVRASFVVYAIITAAVYNLLLRNLPTEEGVWVSPVQWPNEVTHVWIPLYLVLDWALNPSRARLPSLTAVLGLSFPLAWLAFTLVRGDLTGWYPYAFLNPTSEAGWPGVALYAGGIAVVIVVTFIAVTLVNLIHHKLRRQTLFER